MNYSHREVAIVQTNGVSEYWLVSPVEQTLLIYVLQDGIYSAGRLLTPGDIVTSAVLPGFSLDLNDIFVKDGFVANLGEPI